MYRLFFPSAEKNAGKICITNKDVIHHAKDVLRLKEDAEVIAVDELACAYKCLVKKVSPQMVLEIKELLPQARQEAGIKITVACAIPKKAKMDEIIDKLTQLGVNRIIPLETERVIVRLEKAKKALRQKRWEKIALSASQQSQRLNIPVIEPIQNIKEVLGQSGNYDLKLIPYLQGERKTLKEVISQTNPVNILVFIGPEGDFTPGEVSEAMKAGCIPVTLGGQVLRVDTAAIAVAGFIRLYAES